MNYEEATRETGMPVFDDQIYELIDLLLGVEGIRRLYLQRHDRAWIRKVGDEGLRDGLLELTEKQITIIEAMLFEDKNIVDIQRNTGMTIRQICVEIREMRKTLLAAM